MKDAIGDVLIERAERRGGLNRTLAASFAVHIGAIVVAILASRMWVSAKPQQNLMTINLSAGAEGPKSTGMTPLSAKKVEEVAPPPKRPEPIKPPAPKSDAMVIPVKPKPTKVEPPKHDVKPIEPPKAEPPKPEPPKPEPPATPATGAEIRNGTSRVETNSKVDGTGLSTGGSLGGAQDLVQIDPNFKFCCQAYIDTMCAIIERNWALKDTRTNGYAVVQFTIQRNGHITDIKGENSSSSTLLRYSRSAIETTEQLGGLGPLPDQFKDDHLIVHLRFPYHR